MLLRRILPVLKIFFPKETNKTFPQLLFWKNVMFEKFAITVTETLVIKNIIFYFKQSLNYGFEIQPTIRLMNVFCLPPAFTARSGQSLIHRHTRFAAEST